HPTRRCKTFSLFYQHRHRVGLIHEPKTPKSTGFPVVLWVHINTATYQNAMHIGHHTCDPSHIEVPLPHSGATSTTLVNIAPHMWFTIALITCIYRKLYRIWRDGKQRMSQYKFLTQGIQCKTINSRAESKHQHRGWSIQSIACR